MKTTTKYTVEEWREKYPSDKTEVGDLELDTSNNKWYRNTHVDGTYFAYWVDTEKYVELRKRQLAGEIYDLYLGTNIELCPGFENNGKQYKGIRLKVEFTYVDSNGRSHMVVRKRYEKTGSAWWAKVKMYLYYNQDVILEEY